MTDILWYESKEENYKQGFESSGDYFYELVIELDIEKNKYVWSIEIRHKDKEYKININNDEGKETEDEALKELMHEFSKWNIFLNYVVKNIEKVALGDVQKITDDILTITG